MCAQHCGRTGDTAENQTYEFSPRWSSYFSVLVGTGNKYNKLDDNKCLGKMSLSEELQGSSGVVCEGLMEGGHLSKDPREVKDQAMWGRSRLREQQGQRR